MSAAFDFDNEVIEFTRELVQLQSYSDHEGDVARAVEERMRRLGYDEVLIDTAGNVAGFIGDGGKDHTF
ncbi:MAG: hypothetical protein RRY12_08065 [Cloacibacillus sp.]